MGKRSLAAAVALALLGVGAGYAVSRVTRDEPAAFAQAAPVPASDPSAPVDPLEVLPDPTSVGPLEPSLRLRPRTVGTAPFEVVLPVPEGWVQTNPKPGEWRWYPPPGLTLNTYFLRVRLIGNSYQTIASAVRNRIEALEQASGVADFHLEKQSSHAFTADYVSANHRRITMEGYVSADGGEMADAWVALIGREVDREGLADLFPRVFAGVRA